ncbi:efflux RND transporter periplasmic adaptor subunit [Massilibacterium senegalense]|uniref:efflux RND transporter periplasmic adaptor subunit n=1 Tax=Massilibacterium senegalense TaxID=1632858 RepID=UPI0007814B81|nr:efflux RND transporter periplasmic adaptor subunit [Massilibacterium senegalense]
MKKKKWLWITIGVVVFIVIVGLVATKAMRGGNTAAGDISHVEVAKVKNEDVSESILVTGVVVPEDEQKVYLDPEKGDIKEFKVQLNQTVSAGDPLFVYDGKAAQSELNQAVRSKELLQSQNKSEQDQINQIASQITQTKNEGQPQEIINELMNQKREIERQHQQTKNEITTTQEQINVANSKVADLTVKSKIDGVVVKITKDVAKTDGAGQEPVIHIVSNKPFKVKGTVSESDTTRIQPEQFVEITTKSQKDKKWNGKVESISQFPEESGEQMTEGQGATKYPFTVAMTDDTSELRQGFHVTMNVKVNGKQKVLAIPSESILYEEEEQFVFVEKNKKLEKRAIKSGVMGDKFVEIIKGVKEGERVVMNPAPEMSDGMEVKTVDEVK